MSRCVPLLLVALLGSVPGCYLTRDLWHNATEPLPKILVTTAVECAVRDVRVEAGTDGAVDAVLVDFATVPPAGNPGRRWPFLPSAGWLALRPPTTGGGDWRTLPGAERFVATDWEFRVTCGSYFRSRFGNALLVWRGAVERATLVREIDVDAAGIAGDAAALTPVGNGLDEEAICLRAFATHPWTQLLGDASSPPSWQATPIAWLDPAGRPLPTPPVMVITPDGELRPRRPDADRCRLLGRCTNAYGAQRFVAVPVPVLAHGDDLTLTRVGDSVRFQRRQVWRAELVDAADATALAAATLPLHAPRFVYRFMREVEPSHVDSYVLAAALTPLTVALDVLIATNPSLQALYYYLCGDDRLSTGEAPTRQ